MKPLRLALLVFSFSLILSGCFSQREAENSAGNSQKTDVLTSDVVYYTAASGPVKGYLAKPNDNDQHPGIVLIHEWWGLNDDIKAKARDFAKEGYVALAVDLYDGKSTTKSDEAMQWAAAVKNNLPEAFRNLQAALSTLRNSASVDPARLASVGWCFGGGWSYEMAKNNLGTKVSIMYYGEMHPEDDLSQMKALILGHFGEKDVNISVDTVKEFQAKLKTLSGDHEVYIYPNSGHAFANPQSATYNPEATQLAWQRTLDFLKKHLGDPWNGKKAPVATVPVGSFQVDKDGNWSGELFVRGYPEIAKAKDPTCEKDCPEYDTVRFHLLQTTNPDFKKFLDANQGNAAVGKYEVAMGCVEKNQITYANDADENGMKTFDLTAELSKSILQATKDKPVALKLTKSKLTGGREAPICYSHFTKIEAMTTAS